MKLKLHLTIIGVAFILFGINIANAQVGIGTTTPQAGSILDIDIADKGILLPRVSLTALNSIAPITGGGTESLLIYNTNPTVGRGFHYWNGSVWIPILAKDWKQGGNIGTNPTTDFLGTIDNTAIRIRTNNTERLEISNSGLLRAYASGSAAAPLLSWDSDTDTGLYHNIADELNLAAGGLEFVTLRNAANAELVLNETGSNLDTRIETANNDSSFFIDGANDNVGLGTNTPNTSAQLDISDTDKGVLINRVALTATNSATPISTPATGLLVYNTASASSGSTEVMPGFYFWDGSKWVAMGGTNGKDWSLEGNAGTNSSNNFIGTTDNTDFVLRTNDTERLRFLGSGNAGIGSAPYGNVTLSVDNGVNPFGILSQTYSNGAAIFGIENGSGTAVRGENSGTGLGVLGLAANTHGVYGSTAYTGGSFLTGGIIGWGTGANGANGVLAITDKTVTSNSNIGLRAVSGSTTSISSSQVMNVGVNTNATDLGLYVLTEKSSGIREAARFQTNYNGSPIDSDARDPRAQLAGYTNASQQGGNNMYYGGYLYSGGTNNGSWAYAGARYGNSNYKIIGNGTVSTVVSGITENDSKKIMFAPEAPEVLFEDYGIGQLSNGTAHITIDPIFARNILVNREHPLKVFIQLEGDCNGVYVTNKSANSFDVRELQNGNSNVSFSWHIVANRQDENGTSEENSSNYSSLRFPDAPSTIGPEDMRSTITKEYKPDTKPSVDKPAQK
jgi:hypothetical protein